MSRDFRLYLEDLAHGCGRVIDLVGGRPGDELARDQTTLDAVLFNLITIGEAARNLPEPIRDAAPQIEWRKIIAFRNLVVYAYFTLNPAVVLDSARNKIPQLLLAVQELLQRP